MRIRDLSTKTREAYTQLILNLKFDGQAVKKISRDWGIPLWWVKYRIQNARDQGDRRVLCRKGIYQK